MRLGFTGTQQGMTQNQKEVVEDLLVSILTAVTEFHHGDCIGADEDAANIVRTFCMDMTEVVCHPPDEERKRCHFKSDVFRVKKPYIERNHDIVDETDMLIACPNGSSEVLRSGTWATIRYARKEGKPFVIIYPDGSMDDQESFQQH